MTVQAVPEGSYIQLDSGYKLHYNEAGEGFPIIFLHGSGPGSSGWNNFQFNYQSIAESGFRTIVPDLLGYAYSANTDEPVFVYDDLVKAIEELAEKLKLERYALVGYALGGAVAITLAANNPEKISRLVLVAPVGLEAAEVYMGMENIRAMFKILSAQEGITKDSLRDVFKLQFYNQALVTDDFIEQRFQINNIQPKKVLSKVIVPNQCEQLKELKMPILGFWGSNDPICPSSGAKILVENCKNIRMILINECGHWLVIGYADYFNRQCIDFFHESNAQDFMSLPAVKPTWQSLQVMRQ